MYNWVAIVIFYEINISSALFSRKYLILSLAIVYTQRPPTESLNWEKTNFNTLTTYNNIVLMMTLTVFSSWNDPYNFYLYRTLHSSSSSSNVWFFLLLKQVLSYDKERLASSYWWQDNYVLFIVNVYVKQMNFVKVCELRAQITYIPEYWMATVASKQSILYLNERHIERGCVISSYFFL